MPSKKNNKKKISSRIQKQLDNMTKGNSTPFNKLPKADQEFINKHNSNLKQTVPPNDKVFTSDVYDKHFTQTGQLTDEQISKIPKQNYKNFFIGIDAFAKKIKNDVPFEEMVGYLTTMFVSDSKNKSFDDIISKFFKFKLGQMDLKELVVLKIEIDNIIAQKVKEPTPMSNYREEDIKEA
jgi:hypothetical protein